MSSPSLIPEPTLALRMPDHPAILAMTRYYNTYGPLIDEIMCCIHGYQEACFCRALVAVTSIRPYDVLRLRGGSEVIIDTLLGAVGRLLRPQDDAQIPPDLDAALRWHAGRLTDLKTALPQA